MGKPELLCTIFPASSSRRLLVLPKRLEGVTSTLLSDSLSILEACGVCYSASRSMERIFSICISLMMRLSLLIYSRSLVFSPF